MLSVIFYGRNDNHGYNLPKRVALSLNNMSSLLTTDDEILFVDWNTSEGYSLFLDSISDLLTKRARELIKIIKVPPYVHNELHNPLRKPTIEPIARNVAIRRTDPNNRWILSTNTDMVFLPKQKNLSLLQEISNLEEGFYELPRMALPEFIWEYFDAHDPLKVMDELRDFRTKLDIDEVVESGAIQRFDAPGDFQLFTREAAFRVRGFDEQMVLGWHVDSNLCKRLNMLYGCTLSLENIVLGYHCEHTKLATHFTSTKISNDLFKFYHNVDNVIANSEDHNWGLSNLDLEILSVGEKSRELLDTVFTVAPNRGIFRSNVQTANVHNLISYSAEHVFLYFVEVFRNLKPGTSIFYIGSNQEMQKILINFFEKYYNFNLKIIDLSMEENSRDKVLHSLLEYSYFPYVIVDFGLTIESTQDVSTTTHSKLWWARWNEIESLLRFSFDFIRENTLRGAIDKKTIFITLNAETYNVGIGTILSKFIHLPNVAVNSRVRIGTLRNSYFNRSHPLLLKLESRLLETLHPSNLSLAQAARGSEEIAHSVDPIMTSHHILSISNDRHNIHITQKGLMLGHIANLDLYIPKKVKDPILILELDYPREVTQDYPVYLNLYIQDKFIEQVKFDPVIGNTQVFKLKIPKNFIEINGAIKLKFSLWQDQEGTLPVPDFSHIRLTNLGFFSNNFSSFNLFYIRSSKLLARLIMNNGWSYSGEGIWRWSTSKKVTFTIDFLERIRNKKFVFHFIESHDILIDENLNANEIINFSGFQEIAIRSLLHKKWGKICIISKPSSHFYVEFKGDLSKPGYLTHRDLRQLGINSRFLGLISGFFPNGVIAVIYSMIYFLSTTAIKLRDISYYFKKHNFLK